MLTNRAKRLRAASRAVSAISVPASPTEPAQPVVSIPLSLSRTADVTVAPRGPLKGMSKDDLRAALASADLHAPFKTPYKYRSRDETKMNALVETTNLRPAPTQDLHLHRPKGSTPTTRFAAN